MEYTYTYTYYVVASSDNELIDIIRTPNNGTDFYEYCSGIVGEDTIWSPGATKVNGVISFSKRIDIGSEEGIRVIEIDGDFKLSNYSMTIWNQELFTEQIHDIVMSQSSLGKEIM